MPRPFAVRWLKCFGLSRPGRPCPGVTTLACFASTTTSALSGISTPLTATTTWSAATNDQVDIGGFFPGDKLGVPASVSNRPQVPWYLTASLTTNITNNLTNSFHYSYLRNFWARASAAQPPQIDGLGGAIEPFGESRTNVLAPYNLNTQNVRTRFWDGQDNMIRDDLSWLQRHALLPVWRNLSAQLELSSAHR